MKSNHYKFLVAISVLLFFNINTTHSQTYKDMMNDFSFNYFEVCDSAYAYFKVNGTGKGSGWKDFKRWEYDNKGRYYPSGDRKQIDHNVAKKAYENLVLNAALNKSNINSVNQWIELGPSTIQQVTGHYSVGLGRVETFYVDPNNPLKMYLGSRSGGFWKTTDGGLNWINTTDFLVSAGVNVIAVSPTNPDSILINVRNSSNGTAQGIYRSIDGGNSWTLTGFNPSNLSWGGLGSDAKINFIKYHPFLPNVVYIGGTKGIFRSTNNLSTWSQVYVNGDITDLEFHPTDPSVVYAFDYYFFNNKRNYLLKSSNGGLNFLLSDTLNGNNSYSTIEVSPNCPNCVFVASNYGLWKSTDKGSNFKFVSTPPSNFGGFCVSDIDTSKMYCGYLDSYFSNNGGNSFNQVTYWSQGGPNYNTTGTYIHADVRNAKAINGVFYSATDGFLCKSTNNGVTWSILSQGTGIRENYKIGVSQSNDARIICGSQDNGTSIKTENGWIEFYGADGMDGIIHPLNDNWMIGSLQNGGRRRTKDGGFTQNGVTPGNHLNADWVAPILYDPNNPMTVYSFSEIVHKSINFGNTWIDLANPSGLGTIEAAAIANTNSDIIIVSSGSVLQKSIDGGNTFSPINNGLPNSSISSIAFDPKNDNRIIVTYNSYQNNNNKIYISNNQGATWQNITHNLGNMPIHSVVIDHTLDANIYIGAEIGVYTKKMSDNSWSLYNTSLPNMNARDLKINYGSNSLKLGSWGRGLWEFKLKNRDNYPAIIKTSISDMPTENAPVFGVDQYITSNINYNGNLSQVYALWSINTPVFNNVINMSQNGTSTSWTSNTAIPNQAVGTKVYFKVIAIGNANDTSETFKFMFEVKPFSYCSASGSSGTGSDYITNVTLNNVSTNSGQNFYGNFTSTTIPLNKCANYNLQVKLNFHFPQDTVGAWIDFNRNANFESSEYIIMSKLNNLHISNGIFTVPCNAALNIPLRMRVRSAYAVSNLSACGNQFGEVEDYSISINCPSTNSNFLATACNSYAWQGQTYTSSGIYTDTLQNTLGCDSIISLNLTINSPSSSVSNINACNTYNWNGQNLTSSGIYTDTLQNILGCDSIVSLNLTVTTLNNGVNAVSNTLTATQSNASYQWVLCNSFTPILNATNQSFTASPNIGYAVIISANGCIDTSSCLTVINSSINNLQQSEIRVFPNPTKNKISIFDAPIDAAIEVYNVLGLIIYKNKNTSSAHEIDLSSFPNGNYYVRLNKNGKEIYFKIVKLAE